MLLLFSSLASLLKMDFLILDRIEALIRGGILDLHLVLEETLSVSFSVQYDSAYVFVTQNPFN